MAAPSCWIGVAARAHALLGQAGGFVMFAHGLHSAVLRLVPGDWFAYYAPTQTLGGKDVVRLARIASLLEDKVLAVEDTLLDQGDTLGRVERESLQARVDAAEALVTVQERLATIDAKLDALTEAVAAMAEPKKPASRSRSRSRKSTPAKKADAAADSKES